MKRLRIIQALLLFTVSGCAKTCQDFSMGLTNEMGNTDWIVVQYGFNGTPTGCWVVKNTPLSGTDVSTSWIDEGHIVFINYPHNIVQVKDDRFEHAAKLLGVDIHSCGNGTYPAPVEQQP